MPETTNAVDTWNGLLSDLSTHLPDVLIGLGIFIVLVLVAGRLSNLLIKPFGYVSQSPLIRSVFRRAISVLIMLFGLYIFLKMAGLTEFAVAIVSGTGLIGLILGFAFKDIAENFISSLLLTVQRPFRIGDVIQIESYTGVVQKVTSRATTLVDFDGNHIQLPNAIVYKGIIKNLTANPNMRGTFILGIGYDNNITSARDLALSILHKHPNVLDEPEPMVLIDNLGSSTVNLKVYFWINVEATSVVKMSSSLMRILVESFTQAGISMPDDAREVVFPEGVPVRQLPREDSGSSPLPVERSLNSGGADSDNAINRDASTGIVKQGRDVSPSPAKTTEQRSSVSESVKPADVKPPIIDHSEDLSSENDDIRRQAEQARDPEAGSNIL